jgi:hypothetical protein
LRESGDFLGRRPETLSKKKTWVTLIRLKGNDPEVTLKTVPMFMKEKEKGSRCKKSNIGINTPGKLE